MGGAYSGAGAGAQPTPRTHGGAGARRRGERGQGRRRRRRQGGAGYRTRRGAGPHTSLPFSAQAPAVIVTAVGLPFVPSTSHFNTHLEGALKLSLKGNECAALARGAGRRWSPASRLGLPLVSLSPHLQPSQLASSLGPRCSHPHLVPRRCLSGSYKEPPRSETRAPVWTTHLRNLQLQIHAAIM